MNPFLYARERMAFTNRVIGSRTCRARVDSRVSGADRAFEPNDYVQGMVSGCYDLIRDVLTPLDVQSKLASLESSANEEKLGLFSYPVLQAADILLYK